MPEQVVAPNIRPMLCKTFDETKHVFGVEGYVIEPKYDGLRCLIFVTGGERKAIAYSRNGKPFWNIDHILEAVTALCHTAGLSNLVLDGELFTTDWNLSMGIVKSSKTVHPDRHKIKFHVWDLIYQDSWDEGGTETPWKYRQNDLYQLITPTGLITTPYVEKVVGVTAFSLERAREIYAKFIEQGYEGGILKHPSAPYHLGRRSPHWLKWKPWTDADLCIMGAEEGVGKRAGKVGALYLEGSIQWQDKNYLVKTEVGSFRCTDEQLTAMWEKHKAGELLGLMAEIRFQDVTVEGACRFPIFYRLREDRERADVTEVVKKKPVKRIKAHVPLDPSIVEEFYDPL
jgi:ATP-dependent DNA ligase